MSKCLQTFSLCDVFDKNIPKISGFVVYRFLNKVNNKSYIGNSKNVNRRFADHYRNYLKKNNHLSNAISKYGFINFIVEILEVCPSVEYMDLREKYYIKKFDSYINGYNKTSNGQPLNKKLSDKEISEHFKKCWDNPLYRYRNLTARQLKLNDSHYREKMRVITSLNISKLNSNPFVISQQQKGKVLKIINTLNKLNLQLNEENYNNHRPNGSPNYKTSLLKYPNLFNDMIGEKYG